MVGIKINRFQLCQKIKKTRSITVKRSLNRLGRGHLTVGRQHKHPVTARKEKINLDGSMATTTSFSVTITPECMNSRKGCL